MAVATAAAVGALTLTALPAAASSTHKTTTTTTHPKKKAHKKPKKAKGITKATAGQQYLADVVPYNAATDTYSAAVKSVTSYSQFSGLAAPVIAALTTLDSTILRQQWPTNAQQDIKTMVAADGATIGDLTSLQTADASSISEIETNLQKDDNTAAADSNIVRADLGLPPPPAS